MTKNENIDDSEDSEVEFTELFDETQLYGRDYTKEQVSLKKIHFLLHNFLVIHL